MEWVNNRLLYPDSCKAHCDLEYSLQHDLMLESIFSHICSDEKARMHFLEVLSALPTDIVVIQFRQEILEDFLNKPSLLSDLRQITARMKELSFLHRQLERERLHIQISGNGSWVAARNHLQTIAQLLSRLLVCIQNLSASLSADTIRAQGLHKMKEECIHYQTLVKQY